MHPILLSISNTLSSNRIRTRTRINPIPTNNSTSLSSIRNTLRTLLRISNLPIFTPSTLRRTCRSSSLTRSSSPGSLVTEAWDLSTLRPLRRLRR